MSKKVGKRQKFKQCLKSTGQKIVSIAKSRVMTRVLPLFVLVTILNPMNVTHLIKIMPYKSN